MEIVYTTEIRFTKKENWHTSGGKEEREKGEREREQEGRIVPTCRLESWWRERWTDGEGKMDHGNESEALEG